MKHTHHGCILREEHLVREEERHAASVAVSVVVCREKHLEEEGPLRAFQREKA